MPDKEITRAGFGPRAAAFIVDKALLFIVLSIVRVPLSLISPLVSKDFIFRHSALDVISWVLAAAYFVALTYMSGATIGKRIMHLRVEKEDGSKLRFVDVLYRETVGRFLSSIACIGYLMVLVDRKKRAFHDYLCCSCVVYSEVLFRSKSSEEAEQGWTPKSAEDSRPEQLPVWSVPGQTADGPEKVRTEEMSGSGNGSEDVL